MTAEPSGSELEAIDAESVAQGGAVRSNHGEPDLGGVDRIIGRLRRRRDDNALAETMIGLYKMEVVEQPGPWESVTAVEPETPWVDWFNNRRLLGPIGNIPPAEFEALCDRRQRVAAEVAGLKQSTVRRTRGGSLRCREGNRLSGRLGRYRAGQSARREGEPMPITESRADQTLSFRAEPKSVAEACQRVLGELGEVESVSRETGIIAGRLKVTWATNWVYVTLRISMSGEETQVAIQTQRKEGLLTEGGAQRGLVMFTERLGQELGGKGAAGW